MAINRRPGAKLYMISKIITKNGKMVSEFNEDGYLFSNGSHPTKIKPEDLPEWYIRGYMYKRGGWLSAKGVKSLFYVPSYSFKDHYMKYDVLYVSFDKEIDRSRREGFTEPIPAYYEYFLGGPIIKDYVAAVEQYSPDCPDVEEVKKIIEKKDIWFKARKTETGGEIFGN